MVFVAFDNWWRATRTSSQMPLSRLSKRLRVRRWSYSGGNGKKREVAFFINDGSLNTYNEELVFVHISVLYLQAIDIMLITIGRFFVLKITFDGDLGAFTISNKRKMGFIHVTLTTITVDYLCSV